MQNKIKMVTPTNQIPHGVKYPLTLHDKNNTRILGFGNARSIKAKKRSKFAGRIVVWDHIHKFVHATIYEFKSPTQLLTDFWRALDQIIEEKD